jgi:hypothetical protein
MQAVQLRVISLRQMRAGKLTQVLGAPSTHHLQHQTQTHQMKLDPQHLLLLLLLM